MQPANIFPQYFKLLFLTLTLIFIGSAALPQTLTLNNAFAHNDYWHKRPLYDALENGYTHIEADVYLRDGSLVVAHLLPFLHHNKTLERLYLKPLADCMNGKSSQAACPAYPVMLMIDIKSKADETYAALEQLLEKYRPMISGYENGKFVQRKITVVISGHKPYQLIKAQQNRLAFIDEDLMQTRQDTLTSNVYQTASCKYSRLLKWNGHGAIPAEERQRLCALVTVAHRFGKKVRLWASPEKEAVWEELLNCGVDLINTDKLVALKNFLLHGARQYAQVTGL